MFWSACVQTDVQSYNFGRYDWFHYESNLKKFMVSEGLIPVTC